MNQKRTWKFYLRALPPLAIPWLLRFLHFFCFFWYWYTVCEEIVSDLFCLSWVLCNVALKLSERVFKSEEIASNVNSAPISGMKNTIGMKICTLISHAKFSHYWFMMMKILRRLSWVSVSWGGIGSCLITVSSGRTYSRTKNLCSFNALHKLYRKSYFF